MSVYNTKYLDEIKLFANSLDLNFLRGKTVGISGATGLIGSYLTDALLTGATDCCLVAFVRSPERARERFVRFGSDRRLKLIKADLTRPLEADLRFDYLIHAASLTDPKNYALRPVETMEANFLGARHMLELAVRDRAAFHFVSSTEVYGINEKKDLGEDDYGYVDINDSRACYNESKRAGETLAVSYAAEHGLDVSISRLSRVYGPTMKTTDTKALSQFINKALNRENIVLKSAGTQLFNYTYVQDAVRGILLLLSLKNRHHYAYNIAYEKLYMLKDVARLAADWAGTKVVFELPDAVERQGYSKSLVSSLNCRRLRDECGFTPAMDLAEWLPKTLDILAAKSDS